MYRTMIETSYGGVTINHNSDWSGLAKIAYENENGQVVNVELPGEILQAVGKESAMDYVTSRVIQTLEDL